MAVPGGDLDSDGSSNVRGVEAPETGTRVGTEVRAACRGEAPGFRFSETGRLRARSPGQRDLPTVPDECRSRVRWRFGGNPDSDVRTRHARRYPFEAAPPRRGEQFAIGVALWRLLHRSTAGQGRPGRLWFVGFLDFPGGYAVDDDRNGDGHAGLRVARVVARGFTRRGIGHLFGRRLCHYCDAVRQSLGSRTLESQS